jgi:hypothetical protein
MTITSPSSSVSVEGDSAAAAREPPHQLGQLVVFCLHGGAVGDLPTVPVGEFSIGHAVSALQARPCPISRYSASAEPPPAAAAGGLLQRHR